MIRSDPIDIDFECLFARSPNPYVVLDHSLTIVWMNDAYLRATMSERDRIVGRPLFDAFPADPTSDSYRLLKTSFDRVLQTSEPDEIALIRYDLRKPDGAMDTLYWSATHTPLLDEEGKVTHILQHTVNVTELENLRRLRDEIGVVQRAREVQARNISLADEMNKLKTLFEQAPGFVAVLSGAKHRFVMANAAYRSLIGNREMIGRDAADVLPEVADQGFFDLLDGVFDSGRAYVGHRDRIALSSSEGGTSERFLDFVYQPIFTPEGNVSGIFVQGHDVTEEVEAAERQSLLINELNHRVKNTLAIVQGLAMQSFRQLENSGEARATFEARLTALAAAHSLLTESNWESSKLVDTLRNSVEATVGAEADRFEFEGPDFLLPPQAAVSLAMAIHELSTNAIKHGALSVPQGRVRIEWTIEEDAGDCLLTLQWTESGGPPVREPEGKGFGTRLIQSGLSSEFASGVVMHFLPEGFRCTMSARLKANPA